MSHGYKGSEITCDEGKPWKLYYCYQCGKHRVGSRLRLPKNWMRKRDGNRIFCGACRSATFVSLDPEKLVNRRDRRSVTVDSIAPSRSFVRIVASRR